MTGQRLANIEKLRECALDGLTCAQAAKRLNLGPAYTAVLAKQNGINLLVLPKGPSRAAIRIGELTRLAAEGLTRREAAERLGLKYGTVVLYALRNEIDFARSGKIATPTERTRQMAAMYKSGQTLQEIGRHYGITRERVRQLITKYHGLRGGDGGATLTSTLARAARLNKREARYQRRYGCSREQYRAIQRTGGTRAYTELQRNTTRDGIKLELTLWQWWNLWQGSGHWSERGRGHGYWLFRLRSDAPLSLDNYCIAPGTEARGLMLQADPSRFARNLSPDEVVAA